MTFAFYNVENLFDTSDDSKTRDNDFTPSGKYQWDLEKYYAKIKSLAKVIDNIGPSDTLPAFIGFTEVENYRVVEELLKDPLLSHEPYKIVHAESRDQRGIDVAFAYSTMSFTYEKHKMINIDRFSDRKLYSRDIMYVTGKIPSGESIHIFINHWPSRRNGDSETRFKRSAAAKALRNEVEGILSLDKEALILICGDFNDEPKDFTLKNVLLATKKTKGSGNLMNLGWAPLKAKLGTVKHQDKWYMFDQIIVSHDLLPRISGEKMHLLHNEDTIYTSPKTGKKYPNRTFLGSRYGGGVSDHLPVWIELK